MPDLNLPPEALRWLQAVNRALSQQPAAEREETIDGLRSHIVEALNRGEPVEAVLLGLGDPSAFASDAVGRPERATPAVPSQQESSSSAPLRLPYWTSKRRMLLVAFCLVLTAFASLALMVGETQSIRDPSSGAVVDQRTQLVLFNMDDRVSGVMLTGLLLTGLLLLLPTKALPTGVIVSASILAILTVVSTVWIVGWWLMPAAVAAVVAVFRPNTRTPARARFRVVETSQ